MPIVAHSKLPSFTRLQQEGEEILDGERAQHQDIRELHIGLLNLMPDAALQPTERQFMRLVGGCNRIAQFYIHPFTLPGVQRSSATQVYIKRYYSDFKTLKEQGLDALIITGANVADRDLSQMPFWDDLTRVLDFAREAVTSTLCACLATHAALRYFHEIVRQPLGGKCCGIYSHTVREAKHPLIRNINTRFDVPHSRFNDVSSEQIEGAGVEVLVASKEAGVHLAVSQDLFRFIYLQGHPEYDRYSLLKEYKRDIGLFIKGLLQEYPAAPWNYFSQEARALLRNYRERVLSSSDPRSVAAEFPEQSLLRKVDNTWADTAKSVFNNWLGTVYQVTNRKRKKPFMEGIDPEDPLGIRHSKPASP